MGDPAYMSFPIAEYQARCNKARDLMEKKGLKGLFMSEGMNYAYFSGGHRDFSYSRPQVMLLPQKGDPVAFSLLSHTMSKLSYRAGILSSLGLSVISLFH